MFLSGFIIGEDHIGQNMFYKHLNLPIKMYTEIESSETLDRDHDILSSVQFCSIQSGKSENNKIPIRYVCKFVKVRL